FFSLGTSVAVICFNLLPSIPSRAAKTNATRMTTTWKTTEMVRFTLDEFCFFLWWIIKLFYCRGFGDWFSGEVYFAYVRLLDGIHHRDDILVFRFPGAANNHVEIGIVDSQVDKLLLKLRDFDLFFVQEKFSIRADGDVGLFRLRILGAPG